MNIPETRGRKRKYPELLKMEVGTHRTYSKNMANKIRSIVSRIKGKEFRTWISEDKFNIVRLK